MNYIFFFKPQEKYGYFSQWYTCSFTDEYEMTYCNMEQYMMTMKAKLFKDNLMLLKIPAARDPKTIKALSRKVRNFDSEIWDKHKFSIVEHGNYLKFSQNQTLKLALIGTGDAILAEASPYDRIWGTGLKESEIPTNEFGYKYWPGENLLGKALMNVREKLQNK